MRDNMFNTLHWKWLATLLGIIGAIMVSLNVPNMTRYGFLPFFISSIIWFFVAYKMKENSLIALNATFIVINILGIYRWLF